MGNGSAGQVLGGVEADKGRDVYRVAEACGIFHAAFPLLLSFCLKLQMQLMDISCSILAVRNKITHADGKVKNEEARRFKKGVFRWEAFMCKGAHSAAVGGSAADAAYPSGRVRLSYQIIAALGEDGRGLAK